MALVWTFSDASHESNRTQNTSDFFLALPLHPQHGVPTRHWSNLRPGCCSSCLLTLPCLHMLPFLCALPPFFHHSALCLWASDMCACVCAKTASARFYCQTVKTALYPLSSLMLSPWRHISSIVCLERFLEMCEMANVHEGCEMNRSSGLRRWLGCC